MKKSDLSINKDFEANQSGTNTFIGPCCSYIAGQLSPTGLTWKEVAEKEEKRIIDIFKKRGIESPSLEMMYCKGHKYIRTKKSPSLKSIEDTFRVDMEFYIPKSTPKSVEIILDRAYGVQNEEQQFYSLGNEAISSFEFIELDNLHFIAIDFETANSQRSSACSIGIAVVKNGVISERIHHYINPGNIEWGQINIRKHKITPEIVKNSDDFPSVWGKVSHLFDNTLVIAHNASSFDMSVLRNCLSKYAIPFPKFQFSCTMQAAKYNGFETKLKDLCKKYDIVLNHHDALSDAEACAMLAIKFHYENLFDSLKFTPFN